MAGVGQRTLSGQSNTGVYTEMLSTGGADTEVDSDSREFDWERWGATHNLFLYTFISVGKQYAALAAIILGLYRIGGGSKLSNFIGAATNDERYIMGCNPLEIGFNYAYACEWTKGHLRSFPLVGLIVSLLVTYKLLVRQRAFFVLLRKGILVNFFEPAPLKDMMFIFLLYSFLSAMSHFALHDYVHSHTHPDSADKTQSLRRGCFFFAIPGGFFLVFLGLAYDVEWILLPMSKFFEEDHKWAKDFMQKITFFNEPEISAIVKSCRNTIRSYPLERACEAIKEEAKKKEAENNADMSRYAIRKETEKITGGAGAMYFIKKGWYSDLLMHSKLSDTPSRTFAFAMRAFGVVGFCLLAGCLLVFIYQLADDWKDVFEKGYMTDAFHMAVVILHVVFMCWFGAKFVMIVFGLCAAGITDGNRQCL